MNSVSRALIFTAMAAGFGAWPAANPVGPEAIIATIYEALGIDSNAVVHDPAHRPHPIAQHGRPIRDILA